MIRRGGGNRLTSHHYRAGSPDPSIFGSRWRRRRGRLPVVRIQRRLVLGGLIKEYESRLIKERLDTKLQVNAHGRT